MNRGESGSEKEKCRTKITFSMKSRYNKKAFVCMNYYFDRLLSSS